MQKNNEEKMILNNRNFISLFIFASIFLVLSSCGKSLNQKANTLSMNPHLIITRSNLPTPDSTPKLQYIAINSIFNSPSDITEGENTEEVFLKLRNISSLTTSYHQELLDILKTSTLIDFSHLLMMTDAMYFPNSTYQLIEEMLTDPKACENITHQLCLIKIAQLKSNAASSIKFGNYTNQLLFLGKSKLTHLTNEQAYLLLEKAYANLDSTKTLFNEIIGSLENLSSIEKISFTDLAILKSAFTQATTLAINWFQYDSDLKPDSLISLAKHFPLSEMRDELILNAMTFLPELNVNEAKQLISLTLNQIKVAKVTLSKITTISAGELAELVSICNSSSDKDDLITSGITKLKSSTTSEASELIRLASKNKTSISNSLIALIPNFKAADLVSILSQSSSGESRENILQANINRFSTLTAKEARIIADQSPKNTVSIILNFIPKIALLTGADLAYLVEAINSGPGRDEALSAGVKLVTSSDLESNISILKMAYNLKFQVTISLLAKTPSLKAIELARLANECLNETVRDQILLKGSDYLTETSINGVSAMVNLATKEKINVALITLAKLNNSSATDLGLILKTINDGHLRDQLIAQALGILKIIDGAGAAIIVERSYDTKVETAARLISLIPNANGSDLDKILAICGSGNTRDLILSRTIGLLGKLTKEEAKSLYSRAYNNKESVAILLMTKVDDFDGQIIGEIAMFSSRGTTRDLIITEGLKRLKKVDTIGLISMIKASFKLTERLALEVSSRIEDLNVDNAIDISNALTNNELREKFLIHSIDLISDLDEPSITQLALAASTQEAREEIVKKGVEKLGDTL